MSGRAALAAAAIVVLSLVAFGAVGAGTVAADELGHEFIHECAEEPPEDFADPEAGNGTIGWFGGYWYNEPLDIDAENGLTEEELTKLSARTAARFEAMRCLTFSELPPVEIMDRDEFAQETTEEFERISANERTFDNAQLETMLLVDSQTDSIAVREGDRAVSVGGYYDFVDERIVVISDDPDSITIDEPILAHELGHALQDQHFDLATYERPTKDIDRGKLGVIEGDVHLIEHRYAMACEEDRWEEECVMTDDPDEPIGSPHSWGLWASMFQPYSDGPAFVEGIYQEGLADEEGWDAVNTLYDDLPTSATHTIYPETYNEFRPESLEVTDHSTGDWERVQRNNGLEHNEIGPAGLVGMFADPGLDAQVAGEQPPPDAPIHITDEFLNDDPMNPYNYDHEMVEGWIGDALYVYENDGRTGTVWKTAWDTQTDVTEFREAYEALLAIRGAQVHPAADHIWVFEADSEYEMVVALEEDDDRLWIITAPSVDELANVHGQVTVPEEADDIAPGEADDSLPADETTPSDEADDDDGLPGFGPIVALLAMLVAALLVRQRLAR